MHTDKFGAEKMKIKPLPEATQKRIIAAVRVLLVVVGAAAASVAIAGLLDLAIMDTALKFFLLALGIVMILTGVFRVNLVELVV